MRKTILLFSTTLVLSGFIKFNWDQQEVIKIIRQKKMNLYGCNPDLIVRSEAGKDGKFITVLPGWGDYSFAVNTKSDSAQFYFNQGINMYYSYHWQEANNSFKEAERFDPALAIAYW